MMSAKIAIIVALLHFMALNEGKPTFGLLNTIKNAVSDGRCKLHKFGTNILEHQHAHGDPCGKEQTTSTTTTTTLPPTPPTTELYPKYLDIDVRLSSDNAKTRTDAGRSMNAEGFASVPDDGGRNIGRVKCNKGQVETADGCMDEA